MNFSERETEGLSRQRVRHLLLSVIGFVIVLAGIAANDALVRADRADTTARQLTFVLSLGGGALLIFNMVRFAAITRRSLLEPALRRKLWDELAATNHLRSMMTAYFAMLLVLVVLAIFSMFTTLSAPWVINGVMVAGLATQAVAFAVLERRGGHAGE